jgi:nucleoporin SEH1
VRIWKVKPGSEDDNEGMGDNDGEEAKWTAVSVADFDQHKSVEFLFLSFFFFSLAYSI